MSVAAFAGKREIMDMISPLGAVYQAGTLSGNPVAMAAGIASLSKIYASSGLYERLGELARRLTDGLCAIAQRRDIALQTACVGSMFGYFFADEEVRDYDGALRADTARFAKFHGEMIKRGVFLAPSQFETGFICSTMNEAQIDFALNAADEAMAAL